MKPELKENDTIEDLTSLRDRLTELFGESVHDLGTALYDVVIKDDHEKLAELLYALPMTRIKLWMS